MAFGYMEELETVILLVFVSLNFCRYLSGKCGYCFGKHDQLHKNLCLRIQFVSLFKETLVAPYFVRFLRNFRPPHFLETLLALLATSTFKLVFPHLIRSKVVAAGGITHIVTSRVPL